MAARSSSNYRVWLRPFRHWWRPLTWIWGVLLLGVFTNVGSSWLIAKNLNFDGSPLEWLIGHPWIPLPPLSLLVLLTLLARVAWTQEFAASPASSFTLTPKQRLQFIRGFQQEYLSRSASSLQGQVTLELHLQERTNLIASSANAAFHHVKAGKASQLTPGASIIQAYDYIQPDLPQQGLLLVGVPGSGKTTLLLELALELLRLAENDPDQPLAIILNLSSWASTQLPLAQWLSKECLSVYGISERLTTPLIAQERVQFLLDGLNEMEITACTGCIKAINTYRQEHLTPLVVCSRSQEYESQPARLELTTAVEIQELELEQVLQALKQAGKPAANVLTALHNNATLRDLLATPLMLSVVLVTYGGKTAQELPQMGSPEEQQRQIFEQYVQSMLKRYQQQRSFSLAQTISSLVWLAQQMQQRHLTEFRLELLQADWQATIWALPIFRLFFWEFFGTAFGLLIGLVFGVIFFGWAIGLAIGLFAMPIGRMILRQFEPNAELAEKLTWSWKRSGYGLVGGLIFGLLYVLYYGLVSRWTFVLSSVLLAVLPFSCFLGVMLVGLDNTSLKKGMYLKPNQGTHASGWNALRLGLLFFLVSWLIIGLSNGFISGVIIGLIVGLGFGFFYGGKAYIQHYVIRFLLARTHELPWRAIPFLEEAKRCILLQRVGGGYRFVHPLLQEYFASLSTAPATP